MLLTCPFCRTFLFADDAKLCEESLPLMYILDLSDILFFIKSIKKSSDNFNILHLSMYPSVKATQDHHKLNHTYSQNNKIHNYFKQFP